MMLLRDETLAECHVMTEERKSFGTTFGESR
jgi:hypothetical protein